jgi:predicted nucleic acid-binding protein
MTTAIDTNVFVALLAEDLVMSAAAQKALDAARKSGALVASGPVCAELIAHRDRSEAYIEGFFRDTDIIRDWNLNEEIWKSAGRAFRAYAERRKANGHPAPRRILADFLIGAHAQENGCSLLTLDKRLYSVAFPKLKVVSF